MKRRKPVRRIKLEKCPDTGKRRAALRALTATTVDFKAFRICLNEKRNELIDLPGKMTNRRRDMIESIKGVLDLTECPQNMLIDL